MQARAGGLVKSTDVRPNQQASVLTDVDPNPWGPSQGVAMPDTTPTSVPVVLELFALDDESCAPCRSARSSLRAAAQILSQTLDGQGYVVATRVVVLQSADHARALRVVSSPTVRVNGHDVALAVEEQTCSTCSTLAGTSIECRTYEWDGRRFDHPPVPLIVDAVHRHLAAGASRAAIAPEVEPAGAPSSVERFLHARSSERC